MRITESFMRMPLSFMRSIKRLAQTNSAANTVNPKKITTQPGPGVKIIIAPTKSSVKPPNILKKRFTCSIVRNCIRSRSEASNNHFYSEAFARTIQQPAFIFDAKSTLQSLMLDEINAMFSSNLFALQSDYNSVVFSEEQRSRAFRRLAAIMLAVCIHIHALGDPLFEALLPRRQLLCRVIFPS
jgi:hypothetical protein